MSFNGASWVRVPIGLNGLVLKVVSGFPSWQSDISSDVNIEEGDVSVASGISIIDFGSGFDLSESPGGEVNIVLDYTEDPVNLSGSEVTGTLAAARFPALTGDVTTSAGSLATTIADNAVDGTDITISSEANGSLMYYFGGTWVNLGIGSEGQVLKVVDGVPTWTTP